jgi:SAM-dependent methyltransferase
MLNITQCNSTEFCNTNFEASYNDFVIKVAPTNNTSYFRVWEYAQAFFLSEFSHEHSVLDVGSLFTIFPAYVGGLVKNICLTDNWAWAETSSQKIMEVEEWCNFVTSLGSNITIKKADVTSLPFVDNSFDRVLCVSTIEHVEHDRKGMEEMMRVLKPKGRLIVTTEYHPTWDVKYTTPKSFRIYTPETLEALVDNLGIVSDIRQTEVRERFAGISFSTVAFYITKRE